MFRAQEHRQIMLLSTRTRVNDVAKHKNKGKRGEEAYEQRQLRLLSTRQGQMRFLSTRTNANEVHKPKIKTNYVAKHKKNDK